MKIAFTGTHSSGKTTLIKYVIEQLKDLDVITIQNITRTIIKRGFPLGKDSTVDSYMIYVGEQLKSERHTKNQNYNLIISDRTVLDTVAYALSNIQLPRPFIPVYCINMLKEIWLREKDFYDLYVYLPIEFPMVIDGIRDVDEDYRHLVDTNIGNLLQENDINFITLRGTVEERFNLLYNKISDPKYLPSLTSTKSSQKQINQDNNITKMEGELIDAGFEDIITSPLFQRLKKISFLGLLDYVYSVGKPSTRYEHTISVANLSLLQARYLKLTDKETEILVGAALLHDVGHAPFSHNSEPFLLEHKNLYHTGVLSNFLRQSKYLDMGILGNRADDIKTGMVDLLLKRNSNMNKLHDIFHIPLSCDKIEGNNRTLTNLGMEGYDLIELMKSIIKIDGKFYAISDKLDIIEKFWLLEIELYWRWIYTKQVFSAEAMLTRCLETCFSTDESVNSFIIGTDEDTYSIFTENKYSKNLFRLISTGNFFHSLDEDYHDLFLEVTPKFAQNRFDKESRRQLESEIANKIGIPNNNVISHFSRRKHFSGGHADLRQIGLFDNGPEYISLDHIDRILSREKISGDFFDVFILSET